MTRKMKAFMWYEKVILRGIEGLLSDKFLLRVVTDNHDAEFDNAVQDHFEAKNMAEALYCETRGWAK